MDIDYSLFKDSKENETEKEKIYFNNSKEKIKIYIMLILLFLFIIYIFFKKNSVEKSIEEEKEIIVLVKKKGNITEVPSWNLLDKFNNIFNLYRLYDIYDEYIGTPFNITNKI